jgi:hypothetical protein
MQAIAAIGGVAGLLGEAARMAKDQSVMGHALKQRPSARSNGSEKIADSKNETQGAFNGVTILDAAEFEQFEKCMMNPGEPSEAILEGEALLEKLYNNSKDR